MCDICNKAHNRTMAIIANEYVINEKIKFSNSKIERTKEMKKMLETDKFIEYAKKRIPEIVKETPIFTVAEFENGKVKSVHVE